MTKDEARDCDHGRMKGKCDVCDLQAELEATNRQVEILSDALAESRREVAAKDKALDLALEALEYIDSNYMSLPKSGNEAITALRTAIEQAETQEPVKRWPFVETPEQFSNRLFEAIREFGSILPAVRNVLIENPPLYTATPSAPVQEPVAWQYRDANDDGTWSAWLGCDKRLTESTYREVRPLYTTPPAQEFVCSTGLCHYRKPLTNEQVGKAARDAHIAFCLNKHQTYEHALTRAVEASHGITGETK